MTLSCSLHLDDLADGPSALLWTCLQPQELNLLPVNLLLAVFLLFLLLQSLSELSEMSQVQGGESIAGAVGEGFQRWRGASP